MLEKQHAMETWENLLELGALLSESNPDAKSVVAILNEMREDKVITLDRQQSERAHHIIYTHKL